MESKEEKMPNFVAYIHDDDIIAMSDTYEICEAIALGSGFEREEFQICKSEEFFS